MKKTGLGTLLLVAWLTSGLATIVHANEGASLRVTIAGSPTPVTIEVRSEGDASRRWTTTLDRQRTTVIRGLPADAVEVTVTSSVGKATKWPTRLEAGEIVSIEVTVGADPPVVRLVDRTSASPGTTFRRDDLDALPSGADLSATLDAAAPFVIADRIDNGGLGTGMWTLVGSRGASWTTNTLVVGDLQTTNTAHARAWTFLPDLAAASSVSVISGGLDATFDAPGAAIIVRPRRPGAAWRRVIDVAGTSAGMVSSPAAGAPPIARIDNFGRIAFDAGGPINDAAGLMVSAGQNRSEWFRLGESRLSSTRATSLFASLVARPAARDEIRIQGAIQQLGHPFDGRKQFRNDDVPEHDWFGQTAVTWDRQRPDGAQTEYSVGFERTSVTPLVGDTAGGVIDRVIDGVVPAPASADVRLRLGGRAEFDFREFGASRVRHAVRVGGSVDRTSLSTHLVATSSIAELVNGLAARVWVSQAANDASRQVIAAAVFASDRIALASHVTLDVGLRATFSHGSASGTSDAITWSSLLPRAALRWGGGAGALAATYGRYQSPLTLAMAAFGDPNAPLTRVYRWTDVNLNKLVDAGEAGPLIAVVGTNQTIASVDSALAAPYTDEFTVSGEAALGASMRLRGTIAIRRERSIVRSVNVGAPLTSYRPVPAFDAGPDDTGAGAGFVTIYDRLPSSFGLDRYLLTNPDGDDGADDSVEAAWDLRTQKWSAMAGAMAYRTRAWGGNRGYEADENDQGVLGERHETPNAAPPIVGAVFFDRSYVLKWWTSYRPGRGVMASFTARYQDGQPFARLVVAPNLAQGPDFIAVDRVGHTRFTFLATIDTRVQKTFTWGHTDLAVALDVFNLTNRANEVEENVVAGPGFRATTAVQPPRTLRLSVRFGF